MQWYDNYIYVSVCLSLLGQRYQLQPLSPLRFAGELASSLTTLCASTL